MRIYKPRFRGKEGPHWWLYHFEKGEVIRESLETGNRAFAQEVAEERVREFRKNWLAEKLEVAAPKAQKEDPAELIVEFLDLLEERQVTEKHRDDVRRHLTSMFDLMDATRLDQVTPDRIRAAIARIDRSARTKNKHRRDLSAFFRWLVREERWPRNPCEAVKAFREIPERERRALTVDELSRLLASSPRHRMLIYRVAANTGLRRAELAQLRWKDVDLEGLRLKILIRVAKSRKSAVLPIEAETATIWKRFRDQGQGFHEGVWRGPEQRVWRRRIREGFALPPIPNVSTYYRDLVRIGVLEREEGAPRKRGKGRRVGRIIPDADFRIDVHGLRTTFGTNLGRAGVPLTVAKELMRHSDPKLTANVYTKLELADARPAVEALGKLIDGEAQKAKDRDSA